MEKVLNWIKKHKIELILGVCLLVSLFFLFKTLQSNIDNKRRNEHNIEALTDSIHYYKGKNGELVASKTILEMNFKDLEKVNEELQEKIKSMGTTKPQQVVYIETVVENVVHDTTWIVNDTVINERFDFSDNWRKLNGSLTFRDKALKLSIDEDKVFVNYYMAIQDGRVYLTSDNPYVKFTEIQGLTVPVQRKKHFGVGIGPSVTMTYDFANRKPLFVPGISLGVYWNFIQF